MSTDLTKLLTRRQCAETLALSLRTIDSLLQRGEINHVRIGSAIRVKPSELSRFVEARTTRRQVIRQRRNLRVKGGSH